MPLGWFLGCYPSYLGSSLDFLPYSVEIQDEPFCPSDEDSPLYENKILFVVDKTSSSKDSDPSNLRFKNIRKFIEQHENLNLSYGIIYFQNEETKSLFSHEDTPIFTKDKSLINTQLDELEQARDRGREDYDSILDSIETILKHDQEKTQSPVVGYHIYYISDGSEYEFQEKGEIRFLNGIFRLMKKRNNVKVNGVYYGNYMNRQPSNWQKVKKIGGRALEVALVYETGGLGGLPLLIGRSHRSEVDEESSDETHDVWLLKSISLEGKGEFVDLNKAPELKLDSEATELLSMDRFFIYNLSSAFCFDGYMDVDSDLDGLCDRDEEQMEGFFANKKFSFDDGYGDAFHWWAFSEGDPLPPCLDRRDEDQDLLTSCEERYLNLKFKNEEGMIPLKEDHPDSDGDSLIDGIETSIYLSVDPQASLDPYNLSIVRFAGDESDLNKLLKHMSPFISSQKQDSFGVHIVPISDGHKSCYGIRSGSFPLYSTLAVQDSDNPFSHKEDRNILFIYALQKKGQSENKIYQFGFKSVDSDSSQLTLPQLKTRLF